jgi:hypothetical protein
MRDLKSPAALWLKAILFIVISVSSAVMLWLEFPTFRGAALLLLLVWASCRAYYFAFYVIHHYADPNFRYSGIWSLMTYLFQRRSLSKTMSSPRTR